MTAAQKKVAALNMERTIHVTGGKGRVCEAAAEGSDLREGNASLTLNPGQGPTELKALIKKTFGKLSKFRVSLGQDRPVGGVTFAPHHPP